MYNFCGIKKLVENKELFIKLSKHDNYSVNLRVELGQIELKFASNKQQNKYSDTEIRFK